MEWNECRATSDFQFPSSSMWSVESLLARGKCSKIQEKQTNKQTERTEQNEANGLPLGQINCTSNIAQTEPPKESRRTAHETRTTPRTTARTPRPREQKPPHPPHRTIADEAQHTTPVPLDTGVGIRWGGLVVHVAVGPGGGVSLFMFSSPPRNNNVEK